MVELTEPADTATAAACCAPKQQVDCCEPSEKANCCSPDSSSCGCSARRSDDEGLLAVAQKTAPVG